jgi:hypothetical protein
MTLVMTLLVRDEEDVLAEHLQFHLNAGVDLVIATDHRSQDGTTEILHSFARTGHVIAIRENAERIRQAEWTTRMARLASSEHGADWVIESDADEFWWPREGSIAYALASIPEGYGVVRALSHSFIPREGEGSFAELMTVRLASAAPINDAATPFRPVAKVAHRAHPHVVVGPGNHNVSGVPWPVLPGWAPLEVLHFPLRSPEQVARKHRNTLESWQRNLRGDLARARSIEERDVPAAFFDRVAASESVIEEGLAAGVLVEDTRLRDALRTFRADKGSIVQRIDHPAVRAGRPSTADTVRHATELQSLAGAELVRLARRIDELGARVVRKESAQRRRNSFRP